MSVINKVSADIKPFAVIGVWVTFGLWVLTVYNQANILTITGLALSALIAVVMTAVYFSNPNRQKALWAEREDFQLPSDVDSSNFIRSLYGIANISSVSTVLMFWLLYAASIALSSALGHSSLGFGLFPAVIFLTFIHTVALAVKHWR